MAASISFEAKRFLEVPSWGDDQSRDAKLRRLDTRDFRSFPSSPEQPFASGHQGTSICGSVNFGNGYGGSTPFGGFAVCNDDGGSGSGGGYVNDDVHLRPMQSDSVEGAGTSWGSFEAMQPHLQPQIAPPLERTPHAAPRTMTEVLMGHARSSSSHLSQAATPGLIPVASWAGLGVGMAPPTPTGAIQCHVCRRMASAHGFGFGTRCCFCEQFACAACAFKCAICEDCACRFCTTVSYLGQFEDTVCATCHDGMTRSGAHGRNMRD